ncbi:MAG: sigma-70 family RNA polymerase sigma factor [Succinatimonas sp.]|nr:sigma-70 family RNA polymerase sigma factor [Succinatimonas sp.]
MNPPLETINASSSDAAIVRRVQQGDSNAYNLLVLRYQHKVVQIALKFVNNQADACDIAQEAFLKAYRAIGNFRGESGFYTWLYRIVINTARTFLESTSKQRNHVDVDAEDINSQDHQGALTSVDSPDRIIESQELQQTIMQALAQLPYELRQAITLREVEGLAYDDIAKLTGVPTGTVRSRIFRARQFIEEKMVALGR